MPRKKKTAHEKPHDPRETNEDALDSLLPLPRAGEGRGEGTTGQPDETSENEGESESESESDGEGDGEGDSEGESDGEPEPEPLEGELVEADEAFAADVETTKKGAALIKSGAGAISSTDPLQAYMRDVQRYSLLKPEETHELAVRYVTTGDVEAAKKLVTSNLRLVVKIAFDYRRAYRNILDLVQEGNIGLMQAVKKYDPYRGVKLSSYAAWWIRAYILRFILNNWRLVKVGTTQAQRKLFFNLKKEKARLSALGIEPTHELIAERLHVTAEEVSHMDRRLAVGEMSLDAPVGQGDGKTTSRIDTMPGDNVGADEQLAAGELSELLNEKIHEFGRTLKGKEEIIFKERLLAEEPKTLQELGDRFGVSRERVRQIEKRLQGKIKTYLEAQVERGALD
jgi:RNA polymerase sigma-32 factor